MVVTPLFLGTLVFIQICLTIVVGRYRLQKNIHFLDGQDTTMTRRMRAHGNFTETVPIALLALSFAELQHAPSWLLWSAASCLLVGRLVHAATILRQGWGPGRAVGMLLTFAAMAGCGGFLIITVLRGSF